jgi:hypothetical protein
MPKGHPFKVCRGCLRTVTYRTDLSLTGLCGDCGPRIQNEQVRQLVEHRGPHFDHWRQRCLAAFSAPHIHVPKPER